MYEIATGINALAMTGRETVSLFHGHKCPRNDGKRKPLAMTGRETVSLFHGDGFCEVAGLVDIAAASRRHVVSK